MHSAGLETRRCFYLHQTNAILALQNPTEEFKMFTGQDYLLTGLDYLLAALAALAADVFVKLAVVVDDDVDIDNDSEVLWAIATRTQPDRATFFVPDSTVSRLDPASYSIWNRWEKDSMNTKWAIDATMPVEAPFEARADVPRRMWENLDLSQYIVPTRR
jgi:2,5-furandicarboxylate decarboxylase 1